MRVQIRLAEELAGAALDFLAENPEEVETLERFWNLVGTARDAPMVEILTFSYAAEGAKTFLIRTGETRRLLGGHA